MDKSYAALAVALAAMVATVAALVLLSDDGDIEDDIIVNKQCRVTIDGDGYTKFMLNGNGPWGDSEGDYDVGASISLEAVTDVGHFDGYYVGGKRVCSDTSYAFTVDSDVSVRLVTKDVAVLKLDGGDCRIYLDGVDVGNGCEKAVTVGTRLTAYAVAGEGRIVTGWTGSCGSSSPVCAFSADSDMELSVSSRETSNPTSVVSVAVNVSDWGGIVAYGQNVGEKYSVRLEISGDPLILSAEPADGHSFSHWTLNTGDVYTDADVEIVAESDRLLITGIFSRANSP